MQKSVIFASVAATALALAAFAAPASAEEVRIKNAVARVAVGVLAAGIVPVRSARTFGQRVGARVPLAAYAALA